ncbi:MAG TPA: hypothetical protein VIG39_03105 [Rhizomicrobium sp.]
MKNAEPNAAALPTEHAELIAVSDTMAEAVPQLAAELGHWRDMLEEGLKDATTDLDAERHLEEATRSLRHIWLAAAANSTSKAYRSPSDGEAVLTPSGRFHNFGYERDLQPEQLERRCARFFPPPPPGWTADHVVYSSGQAAMNAVLTHLTALHSTLGVHHAGAYFETRELLALYAKRMEQLDPARKPGLVIAEPVWCDGIAFGQNRPAEIAALCEKCDATMLIIDSTLAGLDDGLNHVLDNLSRPITVFRIHSGLKLFQQGLELADIGIVSIYGGGAGEQLRSIRTLHGTGLRFADVAALELSCFLDAPSTRRYEEAIFARNAGLARAMSETSGPFAPVVHPSLSSSMGRAPFCIFTLADPGADPGASYEALERAIAAGAERRNLVLDRGGSFGFRGHRFEVVRPDGRPPFLRVALGRRGGPSLEGVIDLLSSLSL